MTDNTAAQLTAANKAVATIDRNVLDLVDCRILLEIEDSLAGLARACDEGGDRDV